MPGKSPNATPDTPYHTFDSHSILTQFDPSSYLQETPIASPDAPQVPELRPALHFQHGMVANPQASGNELGIYEAPPNSELSPLDAFDETTELLARVPEERLHDEPLRHVRSPILSK